MQMQGKTKLGPHTLRSRRKAENCSIEHCRWSAGERWRRWPHRPGLVKLQEASCKELVLRESWCWSTEGLRCTEYCLQLKIGTAVAAGLSHTARAAGWHGLAVAGQKFPCTEVLFQPWHMQTWEMLQQISWYIGLPLNHFRFLKTTNFHFQKLKLRSHLKYRNPLKILRYIYNMPALNSYLQYKQLKNCLHISIKFCLHHTLFDCLCCGLESYSQMYLMRIMVCPIKVFVVLLHNYILQNHATHYDLIVRMSLGVWSIVSTLPSSVKPQLDGLVLFSVNPATHHISSATTPHFLCNHLPHVLCNHPHLHSLNIWLYANKQRVNTDNWSLKHWPGTNKAHLSCTWPWHSSAPACLILYL
jgi:hypothetical protein